MPDGTISRSSFSGYLIAGGILLGVSALLTFLVMPLGLAFLLLLVIPSLIHSAILIAAQAGRIPLPWEDQFAAVVVSFVVQFPLWMISGFIGFLLGTLLFANVPIDALSDEMPEETVRFWAMLGLSTLVVYVSLFVLTIRLLQGSMYRGDPGSKKLSMRDSMPIHPPM